jgi:hypothetical protein
MTQPPPQERDPVIRFLGYAMMVASVLWILLSGACVFYGLTESELIFFVPIGLASMAAGVGGFFIGRMLSRN